MGGRKVLITLNVTTARSFGQAGVPCLILKVLRGPPLQLCLSFFIVNSGDSFEFSSDFHTDLSASYSRRRTQTNGQRSTLFSPKGVKTYRSAATHPLILSEGFPVNCTSNPMLQRFKRAESLRPRFGSVAFRIDLLSWVGRASTRGGIMDAPREQQCFQKYLPMNTAWLRRHMHAGLMQLEPSYL